MGDVLTSSNKPDVVTPKDGVPSKPDWSSEVLGWGADNIAKPFLNQAAITPWDAIASTTNLATDVITPKLVPEATLYKLPEADFLSASWFAQGLSGGVGMIVPYVLAGRMTGGAMSWTGKTLRVEGEAAQLLKSEKLAQVGGAGIYDGMKDPGAGETRFGNSMASLVGFSMYEYGNAWKPELRLPAQLGKRAIIGMVGASAQKTVSSVISDHGNLPTADQYLQTAIGGAVLNVAMPPTQTRVMAAIDSLNHRFGRGVPIDHYMAAHENPAAASGTLKELVAQNPWVRVQDGAREDMADVRHRIVQLAGDQPDPARLGHELFHLKPGNAAVKAGYDEAQALIFSNDIAAARAKFLETYFAHELDARVTEHQIGEELGTQPHLDNPETLATKIPEMESHAGHSYAEDAEAAFQEFAQSYGRIRPLVEYGGTRGDAVENSNITFNARALIGGETEGNVYDNGDGTVTKVFHNDNADVQKTVDIFDRLDSIGIKVPKVMQYGTTADGKPALVMQCIGDGHNLKYQLRSGELSPEDYEKIRQQYYAMGDTLARNNITIDWNASGMIYDHGTLYMVDPSWLHEEPMSRELVDFYGQGLGPRDVETPTSPVRSTIAKYRKMILGF